MNFKHWITLTVAGWLGLVAIEKAQASPESRPNIILCMADDQGWGDVGYHGHPVLKTPHLDAMAREGLRLDRFYAAAPVCSPTRGSCLTGRHPFRYGIFFANVGHMRPQEETLAETLRTAGYATGHFGKWHLGTLSKTVPSANRRGREAKHFAPPWLHGFAESFSTEAKVPTFNPMIRGGQRRTWWDPVQDAAGQGPSHQSEPYGTPYFHNGKIATENLTGDDSRIVMDRAIPFIRTAVAQKKPFFAVIWFHAPHLPVVAGEQFTRLYPRQDKYTRHYYGCITALDVQMGRLRSELKQLGVARNTMLWYASDNGPEGAGPEGNSKSPGSTGGLRGRKRSLYEGGVRVPGLLVWPARVKAGRRSEIPCCTTDYYPTVLDALGLDPRSGPQPIDGVSLMRLIDETMRRRPRPIAMESAGTMALIDNRYKLVVPGAVKLKKQGKSKKRRPPELYDLIADRSEKTDLAERLPEVRRKLIAELDRWHASHRRSLAGEDYLPDRHSQPSNQ